MVLNALLLLAACFAIFWTLKTKETFPAIISLGMVSGIVLVIIPYERLLIPGFYVYLGFVALAFVYGLVVKEKNLYSRFIICLMTALIFTYWIWVFNHWHGNTLLFPIITLMVAIAGIVHRTNLKKELGFLAILSMEAIAILIEQWIKMP